MQLDQSERGFSFQKEGPLDMRMDPDLKLSAKEIVNRFSEKELGSIFRDLGEDTRWRAYAKAIVEARKKKTIETTKELSDIILSAFRGKRRKIHPATLVFQALRIVVNRELESVEEGIRKAITFLSQKGRIGVLTFHSLEDRIVKTVFKEAASPERDMQGMKVAEPILKLLTKKPIAPSQKEIKSNSRSRSAKLRFGEKR